MSDIETEKFRQIGIDLINEYRQQRGLSPINFFPIDTTVASAFIRSIQLHEKTKQELADCKQELSDFRQEVSDIVHDYVHGAGKKGTIDEWENLKNLIIPAPKPDPLEEILEQSVCGRSDQMADRVRAALDAAGFEIREKNND